MSNNKKVYYLDFEFCGHHQQGGYFHPSKKATKGSS